MPLEINNRSGNIRNQHIDYEPAITDNLARSEITLDPTTDLLLQRAAGQGDLQGLPAPGAPLYDNAMLARLNDSETNVGADLYAVMALLQASAQKLKSTATLDRDTAAQMSVRAQLAAADQAAEAADSRLNAAITDGALEIAGGATEVGMAGLSIRATAKAGVATTNANKQREIAGREVVGHDNNGNVKFAEMRPLEKGEARLHARENKEMALLQRERHVEGVPDKGQNRIARDRSIENTKRIKELEGRPAARHEAATKSAQGFDAEAAKWRGQGDALQMFSRGLSSVIKGAGDIGAAHLRHDGDLHDVQGKRLNADADALQTSSQRANDLVGGAQAGIQAARDTMQTILRSNSDSVAQIIHA